MQVYEKVRAYIEEHGIKQNAVANKCGIPATILSAILNGRRKMYADDLRAVCFALNVSPEIFIEYNKSYN